MCFLGRSVLHHLESERMQQARNLVYPPAAPMRTATEATRLAEKSTIEGVLVEVSLILFTGQS